MEALESSLTAALVSLGLCLSPLVVAVACVLRTRRRYRQLVGRVGGSGSEETTLTGRVAIDEGQGPPITIAITQTIVSFGNKWSEVRREMNVRPFTLRTTRGERVRIEPDERLELIDAMEEAEEKSPTERVIRARISANEEIVVFPRVEPEESSVHAPYRLSASIRAGTTASSIVPERIVSTSEARRHYRRSRFNAVALAACFGPIVSLLHFLAFHDFWRLRWDGQRVDAQIVSTNAVHYTHKGRPRVYHEARAQAEMSPAGRPIDLKTRISESEYRALAPGDVIPILVSRGSRSTYARADLDYIDARRGVPYLFLAWQAMLSSICAILGAHASKKPHAWYSGYAASHHAPKHLTLHTGIEPPEDHAG